MTKLKLKDLYLGNIDAKNELINKSTDQINLFKDSFLIPENIIIDDFLNLKKYFIYGLKGTGKTALLRYLALKANEKSETCSTFILFKSDFNEEDKKNFSRAANALIVDIENVPDEEDFVNVWLWFFHRHIVKSINKLALKVFEENDIWEKYKACVLVDNSAEEYTGIYKFFPKLKHGVLEVGIEANATF